MYSSREGQESPTVGLCDMMLSSTIVMIYKHTDEFKNIIKHLMIV